MENHLSYNIPVSMIRQFCFCPRIFYYESVLNVKLKKPIWVDQGTEFHEREKNLIKRRNFNKLNLDKYIRYEEYEMSSSVYHLAGKADLILESDNEVVPVEIKSQKRKPTRGQVLQLCSYGLLAEECFRKKFIKGIFILDDKDKNYLIEMNGEIKNELMNTLEEMKKIYLLQIMPDSSATEFQCNQCEYLNLCNDRNF